MIPVEFVALLVVLYCGLLFGVAFVADRMQARGRSLINNPTVYALSLTVYCTALSYYGSVGRAATSGLDFLAISLGPTLMVFSWWFLLRRMVRVCREQNIVSLADFIASRYGKSAYLGAVVTLTALAGILPYMALQLKAVATTFDLLTAPALNSPALLGPSGIDSAAIFALFLGAFSILFGARQLDARYRHEGLIAALVLESLVKLGAFLAVSLFIVHGLFNGPADVFDLFAATFPDRNGLLLLGTSQTPYAKWFSVTFLAMMGVMFLPRQFQVAVLENANEEHIFSAMWRFPIYLLVFNLPVIPVALAGLLLSGGSTVNADYFVLTLPLEAGHPWLAVLAFLGGFAASTGVIMISSVALSTMILNHLLMPLVLRFNTRHHDMSELLINLKRLAILFTVVLGYWCYRIIGEAYDLVNLGLMTFVAAAQFAPAMIGGLYWPRANRKAATIGLILGFSLWFYTLLIPSLVRSGWLMSDLMETGLWGLQLLRPQELFGLRGFDIWTHGLFWSLFINLLAFVLLSIFGRQSVAEQEQVLKFCAGSLPELKQPRQRLSRAPSVLEFIELMTKFIGEKQAHAAISEYLGDREIDAQGRLSDFEIPDLRRFAERTLAGHVGAAPARIIIDNYLAARGSRMEDVFDIFGSVNLDLAASREQLSVLYEVAREVAANKDLPSTLNNILDLLRQQFKFDLCVIHMLNPSSSLLRIIAQRGARAELLEQLEPAPDRETYLGQAFVDHEVTVVDDTDNLNKPKTAQLIHREGIKSFAHAPILLEGKPIGVLSAYSRSAKGIFTKEFKELFLNLAGQIAVACRNEQQTRQLLEARDHAKELEIAKTIQLGLLPTATPDLPGISLKGSYVAARQVGGDYYDFIPRSDHRLDLIIADVSGHNIGAALLMAETRTFIRARARELDFPAAILYAVNNFFYKDLTHAEMFITMFYCQYHTDTRQLVYASAGHNQPVLWQHQEGRCRWLDAEGMILGITKGVEFQQQTLTLQPGDVLVLYTDGITEAENDQGQFFGEERLCGLLQAHHDASAELLSEKILQETARFTGRDNFVDDVTLVVMKLVG